MSKQKIEEEEFYNVEEILDKKRVGRTHHYLVKWEGYSIKYATWEPKRHLLRVRHMVLEFEKKLQKGEIRSSIDVTNDENIKSVKRRKRGKRKTIIEVVLPKKEQDNVNARIEEKIVEKTESIPLKVLSANRTKDKEINFLVEFSNGEKKYLSKLEMRKRYALMLCNFYESKMIVLK